MANEYIDLIDEKGSPTGERKLKSTIHRNGDRHKTVHVWIMNSRGELLTQRRAPTKENHPNMWDISCAGHISAGEDSLDAAVRESKEELDLDIEKEQLKYLFIVQNSPAVLNDGTYIDYEFQDVYLLRIKDERPVFKLQTEEVAEVKWVPWKKLEKIIHGGDTIFVPHAEEYKKLFMVLKELEND